jgi:hypothetical protein
MIFITEHFQVFPHFHTKLNIFLSHWKWEIESYKCFLNLKNKGTKQRMQEENEWYFVSNFVSRPPLLLTTISCSFLIHFERFQRLKMHYFKIYKTCLMWNFLKIIVEKLKLQNHTGHLWKNPSTTPFILKGHILFIFH